MAEITAPLTVVDALFQRACKDAQQPPTEWGERAHFAQALGLDDEDAFARIPCLNDVEHTHNLPPLTLVRYRALVQDVFEPELYAAVLAERDVAGGVGASAGGEAVARLVSTKYREMVTPAPGKVLEDLGPRFFGQRGSCYCVPIPGEAPWSQGAAAAWARERGFASVAKPTAPPASSGAAKRSRPDADVDMGDEPASAAPDAPAGNQRQRTAVVDGAAGARAIGVRSADDFGLNFPLPHEEQRGRGASTPCIVKLYDDNAEVLRLCDTIEVVGVLCVDPEMVDFECKETLAERDDFKDARRPSTSLVPRLHALFLRKLTHYHPMLPYSQNWFTEARLTAAYTAHFSAPGSLAAAWRAAVAQLTPALLGDELAAKYLLLQIVSRAFAKNGDQLLGTWTLAFGRWPDAPVQDFVKAVAGISARTVHLPISAETLNTKKWRPRKDQIANRLVAGQLQLAPGTMVLLDETKMGEGELGVEGVHGLRAISALVTDRALTCDFAYDVRLPLEVNAVVVTSQGRPLVGTADVTVPMRPNTATAIAAAAACGGDVLAIDAVRWLIALVTRMPKHLSIPEPIVKTFGEDFARVRQEFGVSTDLANAWMCLARAQCLWQGEATLTPEIWRVVLEMEGERLRRCKEDGLFQEE